MTTMRRFLLQIIALAVFATALIWVSGSGVAVQSSDASAEELYQKLHARADNPETNLLADTSRGATNGRKPLRIEANGSEELDSVIMRVKVFDNAILEILNRYMEDVDVKKLVHAGIRGMLQDLDPFSVLMEGTSYDRLMESTHGKYQGLGIQIDNGDDHIRVISPIEGTPAYRKGLQAGDVIWEINGKSTYKMTTEDAASLMRGEAGTTVQLRIKREGVATLLDYEIERAIIALKSVNYSGFFEGTNYGYIRLSRFAEETGDELKEAMQNLLQQRKLDGVILDLRSNGGGLMEAATKAANLFLDRGKLVVATRGRTPESERRSVTVENAIMPTGKLIILVDEGSASASEILAGAIQDWDRGVIMGQNTYGKGLVQQIFPLGDEQGNILQLKLTTAKYYLFSGRCVQKPENGTKEDRDSDTNLLDTIIGDLKAPRTRDIYYTNAHRKVYGGEGVMPDVVLPTQKWFPIEINLERQSIFFDFAVTYTSTHPEITRNFEVSDGIMAEFRSFLKSRDFDYKTSLEASLDELKQTIKESGEDSLFTGSIESLTKLVAKEKENDFDKSKDYIKRAIKREIIAKLYGQTGLYEQMVLKTDPDVQAALNLLQNDKEYTRILSGQNGKTN